MLLVATDRSNGTNQTITDFAPGSRSPGSACVGDTACFEAANSGSSAAAKATIGAVQRVTVRR